MGEQVTQFRNLCDLQIAGGFLAFFAAYGDQGPFKAEACCFAQPCIRLSHAAHLATEPDFAEHHRSWRKGLFEMCRDKGCRYREVRAGFADPQPTGDIQVDIMGAEIEAAAGLDFRYVLVLQAQGIDPERGLDPVWRGRRLEA